MRFSTNLLRWLGVLSIGLLPVSGAFADPSRIPNRLIDYAGFKALTNEIHAVREHRRITERAFVEMSGDEHTVILDSRSAAQYALMHVAGAVNVAFADMTADTLAEVIPSTSSRVLIYCNNNFENAPVAFPTKMIKAALNVPTFITLHAYGYGNVYELGPVIDPATSEIAFSGVRARSAVRAN